ncbi:hypothetical protein [Desulfosporosinus burensis]
MTTIARTKSAAPEPSNLQQQRGRQSAPGQVRQNGDGVPARKPSTAVYDFENGWHADGKNAQSPQGSGGENRVHHPADAGGRTDVGNGGHHGEDPPHEQPAVGSGGNRAERDHIQGEISPSPNSQNAEPPKSEQESPPDGSFFQPQIGFDKHALRFLRVRLDAGPYVVGCSNVARVSGQWPI